MAPEEEAIKFTQQLTVSVQNNPELATSPFLLSLMMEVYTKRGVIPEQWIALYDQQVQSTVLRSRVGKCIYNAGDDCNNRNR